VAEAARPVHALAPDIAGERRTESVPPHAHGLMADIDPTLEEQVFHIPQRKREPHIHQHHETDYLR